ncbi:hypothetical protein LVQ78_23760 [Buttiauxella sp. A2-C2_NF]|uniref:hypothetical protein n=1 Tax=Buttiauxella ferragutiae TaxID=82989 RepID=UPI001E2D7633|nr:hypothetical protein [Buttiauxella ferragutiae]MCE0829007.1 hypothetical protein [Buttiauxella ferragutiae]UNK63227.1 hypothetical protein MNO13_10150 [Buttiauxella ferragutiae]
MNNADLNGYFRLSLQRALLGNVTCNIRGVLASLDGSHIELIFYYDGDISEGDKANASEIETEVIADFDDDFTINTSTEQLDYPQPIKLDSGFLVYLRKE